MSSRLAQLVARVLKVSPGSVSLESGPHSIEKWDSAGHMSLIAELEKEYGVRFDDDEVIELISVEAIAESLAKHGVQPQEI